VVKTHDPGWILPGFFSQTHEFDGRLMQGALISVVVATHNRQDLLPQAVMSILDQSYQEFELIIVDDASQDNTPVVIKELTESDPRIWSIRSDKNVGPGAARNLGIAQSKGDFVAIMDDDDLDDPNRLQSEIEVLNQDPEVMLVFSSVSWVDDNLKPVNTFPGILVKGLFPSEPFDVFKLLYLESNKITNTTIMFRRELADKFKYPEAPWIGEDWFFFMQLAASGVKMQAISSPLVIQRRGLNRQGLMDGPSVVVFQAQRRVLYMIKKWLAESKINGFDNLHRVARANQIIRESHHYRAIKGLFRLLHASIIAPFNPKICQELNRYFRLATKKVHRIFPTYE
jgi:glycosyltransferase involved in cell wall biosynthesis